MSRRLARGKAIQILFAIDVGKNEAEKSINTLLENSSLDRDEELFVRNLVTGTIEHLAEIDNYIEAASENWDIGRIAAVNRAILRMGLYEILFVDKVPDKVAINEAVELAKVYDGQEAAAFVNGLLDEVRVMHKNN